MIETYLVVGMSRIWEHFCFAYAMKLYLKDYSRTMMYEVLHGQL